MQFLLAVTSKVLKRLSIISSSATSAIATHAKHCILVCYYTAIICCIFLELQPLLVGTKTHHEFIRISEKTVFTCASEKLAQPMQKSLYY